MRKVHHQASFAQNYLKMNITLTYNTVRTWVFFTFLLLWDLPHAKIYKFDFRIRGLVVKLAGQTSSRVRAIRLLCLKILSKKTATGWSSG